MVRANSQHDAWTFLSFFASSSGSRVTSLNTPHAQYVIIRNSGQDSAFWGSERRNWKFDPIYPQKKYGTLSWRSMENCCRRNSGTVNDIQFKLGTGVDHPSGITWHDSEVKRSKVKVTVSVHVYYWNVPKISTGWSYPLHTWVVTFEPTHNTTISVQTATTPEILGFITTYFSIANISSWCTCSLQGPCDATHILLLRHLQGELAVMSLTIFNAVKIPIANGVILY